MINGEEKKKVKQGDSDIHTSFGMCPFKQVSKHTPSYLLLMRCYPTSLNETPQCITVGYRLFINIFFTQVYPLQRPLPKIPLVFHTDANYIILPPWCSGQHL